MSIHPDSQPRKVPPVLRLPPAACRRRGRHAHGHWGACRTRGVWLRVDRTVSRSTPWQSHPCVFTPWCRTWPREPPASRPPPDRPGRCSDRCLPRIQPARRDGRARRRLPTARRHRARRRAPRRRPVRRGRPARTPPDGARGRRRASHLLARTARGLRRLGLGLGLG